MSKLSEGKSRKRKKNSYKNLVVFAVVAVILGTIYFYVHIYMGDPEVQIQEVKDEPQYTLLENTDSVNCVAMIIYSQNMNINAISQSFYKSNLFWPYIFKANVNEPSVQANPLDIPAGVILRIPRISPHLLDPKNKDAVSKAKLLADTILSLPDPELDLPLPF